MMVEEKLSDSEQLLLSRFFDGECGLVGSWRAQRLLARSSLANRFIENLETIQGMVSTHEPGGSNTIDLWDRIAQRIDEEQRAELYLGERNPTERASFWQNLSETYTTWIGGAAGAAIAAVAIIVSNSGTPQSPRTPQRQNIGRAAVAQQVSVRAPNRQSAFEIPRIQRRIPQTFEIDWMRSEGALQLIPDPKGASTIIWITREYEEPQNLSQTRKTYSSPPLNSTLPSRSRITNTYPRHRATIPSISTK